MKRTKTWCYRSVLIGLCCLPSIVFAFTPPTYNPMGATPTQSVNSVQLLG